MEKHVRLGLLLDIYGELLTERQQSILFPVGKRTAHWLK